MENEPAIPLSATELRKLDPRYVTVERITGWIFFCVVLFVGLIALLIWAIFTWPPGWRLGAGAAILVCCMCFLAWVTHTLPQWSHETTSWRLDDRGLEIRRGIWWKKATTVPRARVQHTDVHQGPLMRRFELAKLVVHTAGTSEASVELGGLSHIDAVALRDLLIADKGGEADVV